MCLVLVSKLFESSSLLFASGGDPFLGVCSFILGGFLVNHCCVITIKLIGSL